MKKEPPESLKQYPFRFDLTPQQVQIERFHHHIMQSHGIRFFHFVCVGDAPQPYYFRTEQDRERFKNFMVVAEKQWWAI